jgi:hypothetical protein
MNNGEADGEDIMDCLMSVDEILSEVEELMTEKKYSAAMHKLKEARDAISELREDEESADDRQEVDSHVMDVLR